MRTPASIVLAAAALLGASGCSLLFDPDAGYACDGPQQCADGYRCIASRCEESGPVCGDYELDPGEQCDGGGVGPTECAYGLTSCTACSTTCQEVPGQTSFCGDGSTDDLNGEGCDAGGANSDAPDATCRTDCTPRRCGDGIVDSGEACDAGAAGLSTCPAWAPAPPAPGDLCGTDCQGLVCPDTHFCGDGVEDSAFGEGCDLGAANGVCGQACSRDCAPWTCDREWVWWTPQGEALADALYDTSTAGIVVDTITALTWQRSQAPVTYTWANAVAYCDGLTLAGFSDWRLPTLVELESLVDYARYNPAVNVTAFPGTAATDFWASTPVAYEATIGWAVSFYNGTGSMYGVTATLNVRCVR